MRRRYTGIKPNSTVSTDELNIALAHFAAVGRSEIMKTVKEWGATDYERALQRAAKKDHPDCMDLAKEWGATDYEQALLCAAKEGHIECMEIAKEWGARKVHQALLEFHCSGNSNSSQVETCESWVTEEISRLRRELEQAKKEIERLRANKKNEPRKDE